MLLTSAVPILTCERRGGAFVSKNKQTVMKANVGRDFMTGRADRIFLGINLECSSPSDQLGTIIIRLMGIIGIKLNGNQDPFNEI